VTDREPRRRLTASERRRAILDAAQEAFASGGYHGTSLEEVAQAAGISKALIYEHFSSKRDLHASLLQFHVDELFSRLHANARGGETGEARLRGGVDAFLGWVEERPVAYRVFFRDAADPEVADVTAAVQQQVTGVIAVLMATDPQRPSGGRVTEDQIAQHAQLLSGAVQGLATWWHDHPDVPRETLVDRVMEFAWVGLERLGERSRKA
jgi:AcrR family transcriptional regulator